MTKEQALEMIDNHKNALLNPVEMLNWVWLRLLILKISDDEWNRMMTEISDEMR